MAPGIGPVYRFGDFELDVAAYLLRKAERPVRIEGRPMDLLILMLERRGELVTKAQIIERLWGQDVFIEVETGVHTAVRKVRQALGDSPDAPAFLETVPGKGYRFVGPVEVVVPPESGTVTAATAPAPVESPDPQRRRWPAWFPVAAFGLTLVLVLAALLVSRWTRPNPVPPPVMLAVLPFANLSDDPSREYLADGLAEELIASLGQAAPDHVRVVGRTSMLAYQQTTKSLAQIGNELGVDYLVEGSVRADGARVRITAKLIRVSSQTQAWSQTYEREVSDMLALQRELSAAIAGNVALQFGPERLGALARRQTQDAEAYDSYLRAIALSQRRTQAANVAAIDHYRRAIGRDPRYALAWAGIANVHAAMPINADVSPLVAAPQARAAMNQAFEFEPELAEVQFVRGYVSHHLDWDWPGAEASYLRSIAINPGFSVAHRMLGHLHSQMRRHQEARDEMRRAVDLDPLNAMNHALSSQVAFHARDHAAALQHARRAVILDAEFWIGHMQQAQAYEQLGKTDLALEALSTSAGFSGGNSKTHSLRGYILAKSGRAEQAREVLKTLNAAAGTRFVPPYAQALVYAGLGESDAVFEWLAKAYDARDVHLGFLPVDPKWDPYRADPRFVALLARCGFPTD